jgi:hypothetical protein
MARRGTPKNGPLDRAPVREGSSVAGRTFGGSPRPSAFGLGGPAEKPKSTAPVHRESRRVVPGGTHGPAARTIHCNYTVTPARSLAQALLAHARRPDVPLRLSYAGLVFVRESRPLGQSPFASYHAAARRCRSGMRSGRAAAALIEGDRGAVVVTVPRPPPVERPRPQVPALQLVPDLVRNRPGRPTASHSGPDMLPARRSGSGNVRFRLRDIVEQLGAQIVADEPVVTANFSRTSVLRAPSEMASAAKYSPTAHLQ